MLNAPQAIRAIGAERWMLDAKCQVLGIRLCALSACDFMRAGAVYSAIPTLDRKTLMTHAPAIAGLVLLHAAFVASEYAFVKSAGERRMSGSCLSGRRGNQDIFHNLEHYLKVCHLGKTLAQMLVGLFLGLGFSKEITEFDGHVLLGSTGLFCLLFFGIVLIQIKAGFELPRDLGILKTDECVNRLCWFLRVSRFLLFPMTWLVCQLSRS